VLPLLNYREAVLFNQDLCRSFTGDFPLMACRVASPIILKETRHLCFSQP
jgi:hypothetical protein